MHRCMAPATYPRVWRTGPARIVSRSRVFPPIWSCSVWGLPCRLHYCWRGALLPHLFTLTFHLRSGQAPHECGWRYRLCGTGRLCALTRRSRALPGTLPRGVRTFLPCLHKRAEGSSDRSVRLHFQVYRPRHSLEQARGCIHKRATQQAALAAEIENPPYSKRGFSVWGDAHTLGANNAKHIRKPILDAHHFDPTEMPGLHAGTRQDKDAAVILPHRPEAMVPLLIRRR